MAKEKISIAELFDEVPVDIYDFPKYTTQIINLANQNAQGTRPNVVGQMSELINEPNEKTYESWKEYYLANHGKKIDKAVEKIWPMVQNIKEAIQQIDREMVKNWVLDLVINKTAEGLIIQEFILKHLSKKYKKSYRSAKPDEESKGIDGFVGDVPVSIKSESYRSKTSTKNENIDVQMIYYKKTDKYLTIEYNEELFR